MTCGWTTPPSATPPTSLPACRAWPAPAACSLAVDLGTPCEVWLGEASLGKVLLRLGRDDDAASSFDRAARTIEDIAARLTTPGLRHSFVRAEPVGEVYRVLGRRAPAPDAG